MGCQHACAVRVGGREPTHDQVCLLLASGALEDATVPGGRDDLQSQLDALTAGHDVDDELARMKAQLPASAAPSAIEGTEMASADPPPPAGRPATS
jgi:phage shock protein A